MWKTSPNQNRNPGLPAPHPSGLGGRSDRWALVGEEGLLAKCTGKSKCTDLVLPTTCTQHPRCCPLALSVEQEAPDSHHPLPPPPPPRPSHSREGQREVEALAQAAEGDEGASREAARGHLAEGLLEVSGRAVALEAADQQVDAGAPVPADAGAAAP